MTGESGGYLLRMEGLCRSYRKQPALSGFSGEIELERGLIYGLIGPNGSGKTTLFKLLAGILVPSGGRIFRKGEGREKENRTEQEVSFPAWSRENVVYIPAGERGLRYKNTVRDNVLYFSALKGRSAEETEALLTRYASFLHCEALLDRRVETLSLGQKKKASLLCGLCAGARLILMDEPDGGLDHVSYTHLADFTLKAPSARSGQRAHMRGTTFVHRTASAARPRCNSCQSLIL